MIDQTTSTGPARLDDDQPPTNEAAHLEEQRHVRAAGRSDDPERIREEIRMTRGRMDDTLGQLEDRVAPSRVIARTGTRMRARWTRMRDSVMGSNGDITTRTGSSRGPAERAADVADHARRAPAAAREATRGNPLAAGAVAFGLGVLVAGALPASDRERRLAEDAAENVDLQRVRDEVEQVVDDVRGPVQARAEEGVEKVRSTARSEAADLRHEADTSRQRVTDDATGASQTAGQAREQVGDG